MFSNSDLVFVTFIGLIASILLYQSTRPTGGRTLHLLPASWDPYPILTTLQTDGQEEDPSSLPPKSFLTIRTPYNEQEIVNLVTELYELLVELCYVSRSDIAWPPKPNGHRIDEAICKELGLKPEVVRLMQKIPYPRDSYIARDVELFPWSDVYVYIEDGEIRAGRDPDHFGDECRPDYIKSTDIALCQGTRDGMTVVLDTAENTIRCIEMTIEIWQPPRLDDAELERPDKLDHYRNLPGQHAPSLLRWYIDRIRSLDLIPTNTDPPTGWFGDINFKDLQVTMKSIMEEKYGWPDNFRRELWRENMGDEWHKAWEDAMERIR